MKVKIEIREEEGDGDTDGGKSGGDWRSRSMRQ